MISMDDSLQRSRELWKLARIQKPIILASGSPRRADLLRAVGCPFRVVLPDSPEDDYGSWDGGELLRRRAVQKAESIALKYPYDSILSADTVVRLRENVFGKPNDAHRAVEMLQALSECTHEVWTALCLLPGSERSPRIELCSTEVTFRSLSEEEIRVYVSTGEPLDKAGAYGIQGLGALWVRSIHGCYSNVVGLPLSRLWDLFKAI